LSEETAVRIAEALERLVLVMTAGLPDAEDEAQPLTVMTQNGPIEIR
jgi:hypothetical protein